MSTSAQAAMVQFIHNIPAESIDLYIEGNPQFKDISFREGTPFFLLPDGQWTVQVVPAVSNDVANAIATFEITVSEGNYLFLLSGSPESVQLSTHRDHQFSSTADRHVGMTFVHAEPSTPTVRMLSEEKTVIEELRYGAFSEYMSIPSDTFEFVLQGALGEAIVRHRVALAFWKEKSVVLFTSIVREQDNEQLQTYAMLYNGQSFPLERLPLLSDYGQARLQLIQNAPRQRFDVYLEDELIVDDFVFKAATEFIGTPKHEFVDIGIAPFNSRSVEDVFSVVTVMMESDLGYILFLHQPESSTTIVPQVVPNVPDFVRVNSVEVGFAQTATELGAVDVWIDGQLQYEEVELRRNGAFHSLPSRPFRLELRRSGAVYPLATYQINLREWRGQSVQLYTFEEEGKAVGLQAVTPDSSFTILPIEEANDDEIENRTREKLLEQWTVHYQDGQLNVKADLKTDAHLAWRLVDVQGRNVYVAASKQYKRGHVQWTPNVSTIVDGIYYVEVISEKGIMTYPLSINTISR
jgi:hypothetical protein